MSDKRAPHRGVAVKAAASDAAAQLERLMSKQKYKDAVKQAKLIHKAEGTEQSHRQLELAYFLRAQQLLRSEMPESAVEVSRHLLEFGVTDARLVEEFAPLLVKLGLAKDAFRIQGHLESPQFQSRLLLLAADQAVLHSERSRGSSPEVQEAAVVRQALEALYAGDDTKALELVRNISRSSAVSEWKLLVRGLAAFYRGDQDETKANWSRLDPQRAPMRIAAHLHNLHQGHTAKDAEGPDLEKLERLAYGEPILSRLRELSDLVTKNRWADAMRRITALRLSIRAVDPRLAEKLTSSLLAPLIEYVTSIDYTRASRLLREITRVAEPLAIDPGWNRLWALSWEHHSASEAIKYWTRYIADLESCAALKAEERPLAQALVWKHMAQVALAELHDRSEEDDDLDIDDEFDDFDIEDENGNALGPDEDRLVQQTRSCIERSLQLAPRHRPTYDLLVQLCHMTHDPEKLTQARQRILEVFPEDVETLIETALELHDRDEHAAALEILSRARRHKPLDEALVELELRMRKSLARCMAVQKRWDEGRAQFAAIEQLRPDELRSYSYLARKAIFETKASQGDPADRYAQEAAALLSEPAPLWLALRVESILYGLTKATQRHYAELWKKELRKKCRSETAGTMAALWTANALDDYEYDGRDHDASELLKYLRRTARLSYRLEDLEHVCDFLGYFPKEKLLTRKLVKGGLKANPESAILHLVAAGIEMDSPAAFWRPDIRRHLQEALRLAETSTRPREMRMIPTVKDMLSVCNELHSRMAGLPFASPGRITLPSGKLGSIEDFLRAFLGAARAEDEDEEEDDDDGPRPFFGRAFPASRRTSGSSKRETRAGS